MPAPRCTTTAVTTLRERLDETADALMHADLERLLACEVHLQAALAALATQSGASGDRESLAAELNRAKTSLARCRRLGATLTDIIQFSLMNLRDEPVTHTFRHSA